MGRSFPNWSVVTGIGCKKYNGGMNDIYKHLSIHSSNFVPFLPYSFTPTKYKISILIIYSSVPIRPRIMRLMY